MTDEIVLRPWRNEDAAALTTLANNKKIWLNVRDRFPHPYQLADAFTWIKKEMEKNPVENMAIIYNGRLAGSIGAFIQTDVYRKSIEVGYFIGEPFWGNGIATKALATWLDYVQQQFDVIKIYAEVFENNEASKKVLHKNGFHLESKREKSVIKNNVIMNDEVWVKLI
jgi:[ribosomal protein S5]-alanine N-acetyltransferase